MSADDWIVIGRITKPFGLNGGLKVRPLTEDPGRFRRLAGAVLEAADGSRQTCTVADVRTDRNSVILFCREIDRVEQVKAFVGGTVRVPRTEAIPLPPDSFFQHDLLGLRVYLEDGRYLGEIQEIWPTGSNDVFVVRDGERERLIPAIKSLVAEVDLSGRRIILRWMEGLLDL